MSNGNEIDREQHQVDPIASCLWSFKNSSLYFGTQQLSKVQEHDVYRAYHDALPKIVNVIYMREHAQLLESLNDGIAELFSFPHAVF